jgi:hypothetical protein
LGEPSKGYTDVPRRAPTFGGVSFAGNRFSGLASARMTDERASSSIEQALDRWLDLPETVPAEHAQLVSRLDQIHREADGHKFKIGQTVQFSSSGHGLYVVNLLLPQRDGEFEYSISNDFEPYDRVAKESELS